jgi:hypothetical protein
MQTLDPAGCLMTLISETISNPFTKSAPNFEKLLHKASLHPNKATINYSS